MQTYTQTFHDAIASTDREIRGYIKFNNTFTLRGEDGLISFKCTQNAMDNERFCVGSVTSAMCEASFFNYGMEGSGVSLANSYFDAYVGVVTDADNNTIEYVCMGRFYIAEITRSAQTTRILGYDIAGRLSMDYVPNVAADPDHGYLVMDVLNDIIDQTGVNGGDPFTQYGDSTYVPQLYEGNCRSQWGWLCTMVDQTAAEYSGTRDPADLGYMRSYVVGNGASPYAIDDSTIYMDGLSIGDRFVITSYTTGTSDAPIVVGNGSGAVGLNPYMTQSAAEAVELTIDGFAYYPITLRWRGDPCLDIMDKLSITQGQDTYTAVVMKIETTFNGGLEQRITCWGDSEDYYALSTSPTEAQIKTVSNLVHEIQQSIETADGGVITKILDTDGTWKELVIANSQDLDQATSVWRFNINGLAHSNRYQGGTYTLAMDTQGRIVANVIQTGILQDAQGNNSWNLDTGALTITNGSIDIETNSSTDDRIILNYTSGADEYSAHVSPSGVSVATTDGTNYYVSALTPYTSVHSIYNDTSPTVGTLQGTASYGWGIANLETATDKVSIDSTGVILSAQTNWANPIPQAELRQYGLMFYDSSGTNISTYDASYQEAGEMHSIGTSWTEALTINVEPGLYAVCAGLAYSNSQPRGVAIVGVTYGGTMDYNLAQNENYASVSGRTVSWLWCGTTVRITGNNNWNLKMYAKSANAGSNRVYMYAKRIG